MNYRIEFFFLCLLIWFCIMGVDAKMKLKDILNPVEYFVVIVHDGYDLEAMQSSLALEKYGERHAIIESGEIYLDKKRT